MVSAESMILFCQDLVLFSQLPPVLPISPVAQPEEPVGLFSLLKQPGLTTLSSGSSTVVCPPYPSFHREGVETSCDSALLACLAPFPTDSRFFCGAKIIIWSGQWRWTGQIWSKGPNSR